MSSSSIISTAELAGYMAAHAVWSISDGETLIPILAYQNGDGETEMGRLAAESLEQGVRTGRSWLDANPENVSRAVLIYDGYLQFESGQTEALFLDVRDHAGDGAAFRMAIPYERKDTLFVHAPRFLSNGGEQLDAEVFVEAFFRGVAGHEHGFAAWNALQDDEHA